MAKTFTGESISAQNTRKDKVSKGTLTGNYYQDLDTQVLECVSNPTIVTCGKNLVNIPDTNEANKYYAINNIEPYKQYQLSANINNQSDIGVRIRVTVYSTDGTISYYGNVATPGENKRIVTAFTHDKEVSRTEILALQFFSSSPTGTARVSDIQLELGSVATPYEPYIGYQNNYIVDLRKVGDVSDTLDLVTGKVTKRIGEVVLNGSEGGWIVSGYSTSDYMCLFDPRNLQGKTPVDGQAINSVFANGYYVSFPHECSTIKNNGGYCSPTIKILKSRLATHDVAGFKAWLQSNPVKVYYELATPEEYYINVNPLYSLNNYTHYSQTQSVKGNMSLDLSLDLGFYSEETTANMMLELDGIDISDCVIDSYTETWESEVSDEFRIGCFPSKEVKLGLDMNKVRDKYETSPDLEKPLTLKWNVSYKYDGEDLTEIIDGGTFLLDDLEEEYNGFAKATLYDRAILTDVPYDFTKLDYETGTTTVEQVQEICTHLNLELEGEEYIYNKPVKWYDNMMSVRSHLIYLAELSACNLYMTRDNKLRFSPVRPDYPQVTLPLEYVTDEFEEGDEVTFTRVLWNNGLVEYAIGDDNEGSTLYVSSNNPYVDSAEDIDHIYSHVQGLRVSNIKTMKAFGNPLMNVFDVIEFTDNGAHYGYTLVNSINTSFSQAFMQKLSASVQNENYERTAKYFGDPSIKRIQIQVDNNLQKLDIISEKTDSLETNVGHLTMDYEEFKTTYAKGYVTEDGMESYVSSQISQSADEIRFTFEEALGTTEQKLEGNLTDYDEYISSFIRFVNGQIQLGNSASPFQLVITNEGITINNNGSPVAYFQSEKMLITKAEITQSLQIGNVAFMPDANGSMSLRKV